MNIFEMHIGVNLKIDSIDSNAKRDFQPEEIDWYLNEAITVFVKDRWTKFNQSPDEAFEDLKTLVKTSQVGGTVSANWPNSFSYVLPEGFLYYLSSRITHADYHRTNRLVSEFKLSDYLQTTSNKPVFKENAAVFDENKLVIVSDYLHPLTGGTLILRHITKPAKVALVFEIVEGNEVYDANSSTDCDLPEHTHGNIVEIAANMMIKDMGEVKQ